MGTCAANGVRRARATRRGLQRRCLACMRVLCNSEAARAHARCMQHLVRHVQRHERDWDGAGEHGRHRRRVPEGVPALQSKKRGRRRARHAQRAQHAACCTAQCDRATAARKAAADGAATHHSPLPSLGVRVVPFMTLPPAGRCMPRHRAMHFAGSVRGRQAGRACCHACCCRQHSCARHDRRCHGGRGISPARSEPPIHQRRATLDAAAGCFLSTYATLLSGPVHAAGERAAAAALAAAVPCKVAGGGSMRAHAQARCRAPVTSRCTGSRCSSSSCASHSWPGCLTSCALRSAATSVPAWELQASSTARVRQSSACEHWRALAPCCPQAPTHCLPTHPGR